MPTPGKLHPRVRTLDALATAWAERSHDAQYYQRTAWEKATEWVTPLASLERAGQPVEEDIERLRRDLRSLAVSHRDAARATRSTVSLLAAMRDYATARAYTQAVEDLDLVWWRLQQDARTRAEPDDL